MPTSRPRLAETDLAEVRSHLEPGDILLIGDDNYPGWLLMQRLLYGADYAHTAMYAGNQEVIDADAGRGVTRHPLDDLLEGHRLQVLRPPYRAEGDRQAALDYCERQKGKPFDPLFDTDHDNALYCAELVANALGSMPDPMEVAARPVLGRRIIAPDALRQVPGMKTVCTLGGGFFSAQAGYWPIAATAAGCAAVGSFLGGPLGALAGGIIGAAGAVVAGDLADPHLRQAIGDWWADMPGHRSRRRDD